VALAQRSLLATALLAAGAGQAAAHGFGARYDLPLPLGLYLFAAAFVVALSFLMLAAFAHSPNDAAEDTRTDITGYVLPRWPGASWLALVVRWCSVLLFIALVVAGLTGSPDPFKNPLPVSVWVIGWVGIAYVSALIGNVWALLNPWDNAFRAAEWITARAGSRRRLRPVLAYPARLGVLPGVLLFFVFAWMELIWPARDQPATLACAVLAYSFLTWTGMALFGRVTWLSKGEFLAIAFGLLARFAILGTSLSQSGGRLSLRPPAVGLLVDHPVPRSLAAFVILMLATVTFDGLLETPLWSTITDQALASVSVQRMAEVLTAAPQLVIMTAGLVIVPLIFAACYVLVAGLMARIATGGGTAIPTSEMARLFVLTLVPIAIAYHLSHYLSYLLIAGQFIIPIASDPLALGWNLFGTKLYLINLGIVDARFVWYASLTLIIAGHVIAVWLSHIQAQRRFTTRHVVLRSQLPMLALMVGYTAVSLWILSQPIVEVAPQ